MPDNRKGQQIGPSEFAEFVDADRILDALSQGERVDVDRTTSLLSDARAESARHIPPAPDMSAIAAELQQQQQPKTLWRRSKILRRGAKAIATGGASLTTLSIAGGMAAALAFGGIGYAALTTSNGQSDDIVVAEPASEFGFISDANGGQPRSNADKSEASQGRSAAEKNKKKDKKTDKKKDQSEENSAELDNDQEADESHPRGAAEVEAAEKSSPAEPTLTIAEVPQIAQMDRPAAVKAEAPAAAIAAPVVEPQAQLLGNAGQAAEQQQNPAGVDAATAGSNDNEEPAPVGSVGY